MGHVACIPYTKTTGATMCESTHFVGEEVSYTPSGCVHTQGALVSVVQGDRLGLVTDSATLMGISAHEPTPVDVWVGLSRVSCPFCGTYPHLHTCKQG